MNTELMPQTFLRFCHGYKRILPCYISKGGDTLFTAKLSWKPTFHFREHARSCSTLNRNGYVLLLKEDLVHMTTYTEISDKQTI